LNNTLFLPKKHLHGISKFSTQSKTIAPLDFLVILGKKQRLKNRLT